MNRDAVEARLQREDVPWSMLEPASSFEEQLNDAPDLADIIVVTNPGEHDIPDARHMLGELVVKSDRPVLAVHPECRHFDATGRALVAWNGSHEANRALRASVPLLQKAASVTSLEVNNPDGEFSAEDAASYLSRYGVHTQIVEESTPGSVSDAIAQKARDIGAACRPYWRLPAGGCPAGRRWHSSPSALAQWNMCFRVTAQVRGTPGVPWTELVEPRLSNTSV